MPSFVARRSQVLRRSAASRITTAFRVDKARNFGSNPLTTTAQPSVIGQLSTDVSRMSSASHVDEPEFWRQLAPFRDTSRDDFLSWEWNRKKVVETTPKLYEFLDAVVPEMVPRAGGIAGVQTRDEFAEDVAGGIKRSAMSVRVMPSVLSMMNWADPANCPIFRQYVPLKSIMIKDHPNLKLDSLHEQVDSPVKSVVHRYPDKAILLSEIILFFYYDQFLTRVGANTNLVIKEPTKLSRERLLGAFAYIESQEGLKDIIISGGDAYYLPAHIIEWIGDSLLKMRNVERFRIATRGLAVAPNRFLDTNDHWTTTLLRLSDKARQAGKHFALHTHFNHPNEISWITEKASRRLCEAGLTVRNQTVLLRGINDDVPTTPNFVVDLPQGGGKRLACSFDSYNRDTGVSTFRAPILKSKGKEGKIYKYYDPLKPLS
ncbi:hypothetical protein NUW58_g5149 [Xylaria curta]|uniref:Uncharacterized protein n=1 Tax=Xylaria curta TaxID=42375 RepID=A0ACC1P5I8_9PEZI|nr:hypothetical protein NUW58_g5149 [Xylaria curta]